MQLEKALRTIAFSLVILISGLTGVIQFAQANQTAAINQTINAGTLSADFKDASEVSTTTAVTFPPLTYAATCQSTATATLASTTQRLYVDNPGADANGWTLTIGAATSSLWHNTASTSKYDWNDASGAGCTDGDADGFGGQMQLDPQTATIATATPGITNTGISKGATTAFTSAASNLTLIDASSAASSTGKWYFTNFSLSQKIPAFQAVDSTYTFALTVTLTGK